MIDKGTLDRLIAAGRARGHLTNRDLEAVLPVGTMSADEIALVIVHLEEAGVTVDPDEALRADGPARPSPLPETTLHLPEREASPTPPPPIAKPLTTAPMPPLAAPAPEPAPAARTGRAWPVLPGLHRAVLVAGLVIALVGLLFLLFG